jgi:hypothetical protein
MPSITPEDALICMADYLMDAVSGLIPINTLIEDWWISLCHYSSYKPRLAKTLQQLKGCSESTPKKGD